MISVNDVTMRFQRPFVNSLKEFFLGNKRKLQEIIAIKNVSFEVKTGDVFGVVGLNGSGKSTLLKLIAGILRPTSGKIQTKGKISPLIELGAGFDMELTAKENIYLNGAILGYKKQFIDSHFNEIVEFSEMQDFLDLPIKNYSSGMIARVGFAIATIVKPDILLIDEILSVGDSKFQGKCERRIFQLLSGGTTVLIVSHSTEQIKRLCNKAIWLEKGSIKLFGNAAEVCDKYENNGI